MFSDVDFSYVDAFGEIKSSQWDKLVLYYQSAGPTIYPWSVYIWEDKRFLTWISDEVTGNSVIQSRKNRKTTQRYINRKLSEANDFLGALQVNKNSKIKATYRKLSQRLTLPYWVLNKMRSIQKTHFRFRLAMPASKAFRTNMNLLIQNLNADNGDPNMLEASYPHIGSITWGDDCGLSADETLHYNLEICLSYHVSDPVDDQALQQQAASILKSLQQHVSLGVYLKYAEIELLVSEKKMMLHTRLTFNNEPVIRQIEKHL